MNYSQPYYLTPVPTTFGEWAWRWAKCYKLGAVKDNTYWDSVERQLRLHLVPHFGSKLLTDIHPIDVQEYFSGLRAKYSVESQHKIKVVLKEIFDAAIENGLAYCNPVTKSLKLRSSVKQHEIVIWTAEQAAKAWEFAAQHPAGISIQVLMETAMIRSEMLGLRMNEFDPIAKTLTLRDGLVPIKNAQTGKLECVQCGLKNKFRRRVIPISDYLCERLQNIPREITFNETVIRPTHLFYSPAGMPWHPNNWYHRCYLPFMKDLQQAHPDIPYVQPKELRHTRASLLQHKGVDLYDIQRLLGHRDLTMLSRRYLHTNVEELRSHLHI